MPSSVFASSKHCSMDHRSPLSHTRVFKRTLLGALEIKKEYCGCFSTVLRINSHTVLSGRPSLASTTRLFVNSYSIGPLVPSDTWRLYQKKLLRLTAMFLKETGFPDSSERTFLVRFFPL